jgi:adenine-specific DNA-methyltransferase
MEKLNLHSPDFTKANIEKLAELFPNCVTETRAADGTLKKAIDFDLLKQELSTSIVEGPQERYQLNWPGKREALLTANAPIAKTLKPCREESVDFDTTQNLYIEGDNLDALKLLQETYLGKVKMIYIDPPYNTGNDFIYEDDFAENTEAYFERSNQKDEVGNRLVANNESNGRFHSDWLSMMYSRLKLARNLLKDDGVIFISIDDGELANLQKLCDEVFGGDNFIATIVHKNNALKNQSKLIGVSTEYALIYTKNIDILKISGDWKERKFGAADVCKFVKDSLKQGKSESETLELVKDLYSRPKYSHLSRWNKIDAVGIFMDDNLSREGGKKDYTIKNPLTGGDCPIPPRGWAKNLDELLRLQEQNLIWYGNGSTPPRIKSYLTPETVSVPDNYKYYDTSKDKKLIDELFLGRVFEYPKSLDLIKNLIEISLTTEEVVLDFFSGSATTAHAVMQLNAEDGGNRKFIMVQLPEVCDPKSEAYKAGYKTIVEIGKERIRRAGKKIKAENGDKAGIDQLDIGFRVLKVDSSNMKDVYYTPDKLMQEDLEQFTDNIRDNSTPEDLLFQVLLDWGVDLTLPITQETIAGFTVLFVDDNALAACFDTDINEDFVKELAAHHPMRVVFRDAGFASDSVKINIEQIFKLISPTTEIKVI